MASEQMILPQLPAIRPIGGTENNLVDTSLSATAGASEVRIGPQNFGPDGDPTPGDNARTISNIIASGPNAEIVDPTRSAWLYVLGQLVDHDLDLEKPTASNPLDVQVPAGDPDLPDGTVVTLGGRAQLDDSSNVVNTIAGYLDLSQVYGSDPTTVASLRNADGTLKTSAGDNLPIDKGQFVAGDVRVAENPELAAADTVFVREHNHIVGQLKTEHPEWSGDQLYQGARALTTAEYQNIVYNEYLPALIGQVPAYHGYDPKVSSQVTMEFATAAFRLGHSEVSNAQEGTDNNGTVLFSEDLANAFFQPPSQTEANGINALLRHISSDPSLETDIYAVPELRNLLAAPPQAVDLIAIDIERERDVGLGTLNQTRTALGMPAYTSFDQITQDPQVLARLEQAFPSVDDVDLFVGGLAEDHVDGAAVGPTFQAIISQQFDNLRTGDRFYWQNQGFDQATSQKIASTTLSDVLSRNTNTPDLQAHVFDRAERHLSNVTPDEPDQAQLVIGVDDDNAQIAGGPADDTIFAGKGLHQTLTGNGGADVFVFANPGPVNDTVTDFDPANDKLDLRGLINAGGSAQVMAETGGALLHLASADIHLPGVIPGALSQTDFAQPIALQVMPSTV